MSSKLDRQERRLTDRRASFDQLKSKDGYKKPGSMNPHKSMPAGRRRRR